jgi:hypothetical protein
MRVTYLDNTATAAVAAKIGQPLVLHQSPCSVPGTRMISATPLPVSRAEAGQAITPRSQAVNTRSSPPATPREMRIWAIDRLKPSTVWPRTWTLMMIAATTSRGVAPPGEQHRVGAPEQPDRRAQVVAHPHLGGHRSLASREYIFPSILCSLTNSAYMPS